jgi:hypothetical protein
MPQVPPSGLGRRVEPRRSRRARRLLVAVIGVAVIGVTTIAIFTSSAEAATSHDDVLSGVSCVGPSSCVAVGNYEKDNVQYELAEHWNGHAWSLMTVPDSSQSYLSAVSCIAATNCVAVGNPNNEIDQLHGTKWKSGFASDSLALMYGVSCVTPPESCAAVGTQYVPMGTWGPVAEQWIHPGSWQVIGSPSTSDTNPNSSLAGVSCTSSSDCVAVGSQEYIVSFNNNNIVWGEEPLGGVWNGSGWSEPTPISEGTNSVLSAVSCESATDCMAVGSAGAALVENWNGTEWTVASAPSTGPLAGVSCVGATFCAAVGNGALATWNGTNWTAASSPASSGDFFSVSCSTASNCMAVGGAGTTQTAHWNGRTWSKVSSPSR